MKNWKIALALTCALTLTALPLVALAYGDRLSGIIYPLEAEDRAALLDGPSASANLLAELPSGVLVWPGEGLDPEKVPEGEYIPVILHLRHAEAGSEGFVESRLVQWVTELQHLFEVAGVTYAPGENSLPVYSQTIWPGDEPVHRLQREDAFWTVMEAAPQDGQELYVMEHPGDPDSGFFMALASQCTVVAKDIPAGKRYGMVVSEDMTKRVILRDSPRAEGEALAGYYSGTHAEILGEDGDYYQVKILALTGYLPKDGLREVQALPK